MLSSAQKVIIMDICSIQYSSLTDILIKVRLGKSSEGEEYEDIFDELGFERKDFDKELINTIHNFESVHKKPELVFELGELDLLVFKHILHNFSHKWESIFPKAMANLWNKLLIHSISNIQN